RGIVIECHDAAVRIERRRDKAERVVCELCESADRIGDTLKAAVDIVRVLCDREMRVRARRERIAVREGALREHVAHGVELARSSYVVGLTDVVGGAANQVVVNMPLDESATVRVSHRPENFGTRTIAHLTNKSRWGQRRNRSIYF